MIDGLDDRDQSVGTVKVFPNLESIAEFKVQVGNYDAEFASGGAVINVITRSGANELHGSVFEFLRNADLNARQFFDASIPPFQQNQFGFAVGGNPPQQAFYFGDYQGLRTHTASSSILTEPTAAMRGGDFSAYPAVIYDPNTYNASTNTRQAYPGNAIPLASQDQIARNLLAIMPLPNLPGVRNNFRVNNLAAQNQDQFDVRGDYLISEKDTMFVRATYGTATISFPQHTGSYRRSDQSTRLRPGDSYRRLAAIERRSQYTGDDPGNAPVFAHGDQPARARLHAVRAHRDAARRRLQPRGEAGIAGREHRAELGRDGGAQHHRRAGIQRQQRPRSGPAEHLANHRHGLLDPRRALVALWRKRHPQRFRILPARCAFRFALVHRHLHQQSRELQRHRKPASPTSCLDCPPARRNPSFRPAFPTRAIRNMAPSCRISGAPRRG